MLSEWGINSQFHWPSLGEVTCLAWSSDGELLASGSADKSICIWILCNQNTTQNPAWAYSTNHLPFLILFRQFAAGIKIHGWNCKTMALGLAGS